MSNQKATSFYLDLLNKVIIHIESNIPDYLKEDVLFVVESLVNQFRSHLLIESYEKGLLSIDEERYYDIYLKK